LDDEQLDELVARIEQLLPKPWNKPRGRKRKLSLRDAVAITVAYSRQNTIQEVLAERWNVSQELVSETITFLVPLVEKATREFVPTAEQAAESVVGRACLLDGSLGPCWSWREHDELWTRKHAPPGTTSRSSPASPGTCSTFLTRSPGPSTTRSRSPSPRSPRSSPTAAA
jgi:hypothetical protein